MTKRQCVHHYILDEQVKKKGEDKFQRGICKKCGKHKLHRPNYDALYSDWRQGGITVSDPR